jgi:Spy/CpxP family protein refolding chaperone
MIEFVSVVSRMRRALLIASILSACCCALGTQANAQGRGGMHHGGGGVDRELNQLTQVLSLTSDQQTQVKPLLIAQREKMEPLRSPAAGRDPAAQPIHEQIEAIRKDTDAKIAALLNDDQKAKFAAWQQQRRERRGQGGDGSAVPNTTSPGA